MTASTISSCKKTTTLFDTVRISTIVNDTIRLTDSVSDVTDGLVAYYSFNGGSLNDSSGYGNNIAFNNASPTTDRLGRANNAYLFNGTSIYMRY